MPADGPSSVLRPRKVQVDILVLEIRVDFKDRRPLLIYVTSGFGRLFHRHEITGQLHLPGSVHNAAQPPAARRLRMSTQGHYCFRLLHLLRLFLRPETFDIFGRYQDRGLLPSDLFAAFLHMAAISLKLPYSTLV